MQQHRRRFHSDRTCSPYCRLRVMDLRAFTIWALVAEGFSNVSRPIPSSSFRRYGTSSTLKACAVQQKKHEALSGNKQLKPAVEKNNSRHFTWATRSVCSFWNMRFRASQARPAMSVRILIPVIRGPMVSREAMERTHSYTTTQQLHQDIIWQGEADWLCCANPQ